MMDLLKTADLPAGESVNLPESNIIPLKVPERRYGELRRLQEAIEAAISAAADEGTSAAAVIGVLRIIEHNVINEWID